MATTGSRVRAVAALALAFVSAAACRPREDEGTIRVGHFATVTHATALVARGRSRAGKGPFEERTGKAIAWFLYSAGPSAIEAIRTASLDLAFVGPNPAINAHVRSKGEEVRVVAAAVLGGSALVVPDDGSVRDAQDLRGRRVATPQFGNTQDVAARDWLRAAGLRVTQTGGDVHVVPTPGPEQVALFRRRDVAAVWTVEPWVTRLLLDAKGSILVEEPGTLTTVLVARRRYLERHRDVVRAFVAAHADLARWCADHPAAAKAEVAAETKALTGGDLPPALLDGAWTRLRFETAVARPPFDDFLARAQALGFLDRSASLDRLVEAP